MPEKVAVADKNTILDAIVALLLAYDHASASGKSTITRALNPLYSAYAQLTGQPDPAKGSYGDLTATLRSSSASLKTIRANAKALENAMVTASRIIGTVTALLAIIP